jgi:L,D-transpeptidase-like protein
VHPATAAQGQISAPARHLPLYSPDVAFGAQGRVVRALQDKLAALHYSVPLDNTFDDATAFAVLAYRKLTGEPLVTSADARMFTDLSRGAGTFHVRYPRDGRHVEADLTKQVLAEIQGGRVVNIYDMSSGKPSTPTVVGHFSVYTKTLGVNQKGMVDSNYFIRGYAIHGYADVPNYAASHGCLRIPILDALAVYDWVQIGNVVDVYNDGGGGSTNARGNAGP